MELNEALAQYGDDFITILTQELLRYGKRASGDLINSLSYDIQPFIGDDVIAQLTVISEDYLEWVDRGRMPGTWPPLSAIRRWTQLKGIPEDMTYPIARSIFLYGINPTNVISISQARFENEFEPSEDILFYIEDLIINNFNRTNI